MSVSVAGVHATIGGGGVGGGSDGGDGDTAGDAGVGGGVDGGCTRQASQPLHRQRPQLPARSLVHQAEHVSKAVSLSVCGAHATGVGGSDGGGDGGGGGGGGS